MDTTASGALREQQRFTVVDLLGRRFAVTEFVHLDPARAAYRSYRLDSGEWLNRWDDDGTLICMRSGTLLWRLAPQRARESASSIGPVAAPPLSAPQAASQAR